MPIEDLLAMYGYSEGGDDASPPSTTSEEVQSNQVGQSIRIGYCLFVVWELNLNGPSRRGWELTRFKTERQEGRRRQVLGDSWNVDMRMTHASGFSVSPIASATLLLIAGKRFERRRRRRGPDILFSPSMLGRSLSLFSHFIRLTIESTVKLRRYPSVVYSLKLYSCNLLMFISQFSYWFSQSVNPQSLKRLKSFVRI